MTTTVVPILGVADAAAAVEWYRRLGFEQTFEHRFGPGMPAYVGIARDGAQLHLSEHRGDQPDPSLVYLWVDAVDPLAAEFDAAVTDNPWARDFEVRDPDGNRVRVAEAADAPPH